MYVFRIRKNNTKSRAESTLVDASAQATIQKLSANEASTTKLTQTVHSLITKLTRRLKLKVINVTTGQLKVRSLLRLAGAMEEHQAVLFVHDEDETSVVNVAIVD